MRQQPIREHSTEEETLKVEGPMAGRASKPRLIETSTLFGAGDDVHDLSWRCCSLEHFVTTFLSTVMVNLTGDDSGSYQSF